MDRLETRAKRFYPLMLKTRLYWSPSFSTVHQNVNKPQSKTVKTVSKFPFLPYCVINIRASIFPLCFRCRYFSQYNFSQIGQSVLERVAPTTPLQYYKIGKFVQGTMFINAKNVHEVPEVEIFLNINLNFTISVFTQGLTNDYNTCKKI